MKRIALRGVIVGVAFLSFACWAKEEDFFAPTQLDPALLPDIDAPLYANIRPLSSVTVLNSNALSFSLSDPQGANGATPSGVDVTTVTAKLANGTVIPLAASGLNFTGSLSSVTDGAVSISLSAKDKAGNTATSSLGFTLDRTGPVINLTTVPPATGSTSSASIDYTIAGRITDSNFGTASLAVTQPGTDGVCGNTDDVNYPTGTSGGRVSQNNIDLTNQIKTNSGNFSATFTTYNGVAAGGSPRTAIYCGYVRAFDTAKDENAADKFNVSGSVWRTDLTWNPPPPAPPPPPPPPPPPINFTLNPTCQHFTGFSRVFLDVQTSPAQVSSPYTASVTGPPGGVSGSGQFSGNLDAQGHTALQNDVFLFGTYNWSVTVSGQTATAQKDVNATSCQ